MINGINLAHDILWRGKSDRGMGLPDVVLYYRAMALVRILNWCHDYSNKLWVSLEQTLAGRKLAGTLWIPSADRGLSKWMSPLTQNTLKIWDKLNQL